MIDYGNTAFVLICSAMVCFMTPGLAFFYCGLVRRKNALTIMLSGTIKGASSVSSSTADRQRGRSPRPMVTHINDATPVGRTKFSTNPVVNSGASENKRVHSPRHNTGNTAWSIASSTSTGTG